MARAIGEITVEAMFEGCFILKYPGGQGVGVDRDSGGYPYAAYWPSQLKYFPSQDQAEIYRGHFPRENFTLHKVIGLQVEDL